jgi:Family of unknown function (DUF6524)
MSSDKGGVTREFSLVGFLWRLAAALVLVLSTYNPTWFSYYGWLRRGMTEHALKPGHFVVGVILIIAWTVFVVAARRSLGTVGLVLAAALVGGIVWWLTYIGIVAVGSVSALTWVSLICLALVLAVGLSWAHVWRRLTGQYEVDRTDD